MGIAVVVLALAAVLVIGLLAMLWRPQHGVVALDAIEPGGGEAETDAAVKSECAPGPAAGLALPPSDGDAQTSRIPGKSVISNQITPASLLIALDEEGFTMGEDMTDINEPVSGHPEQSASEAETPGNLSAKESEAVAPEALVSGALVSGALAPEAGTPLVDLSATASTQADLTDSNAILEDERLVGSAAKGEVAAIPDSYRLGNAAFAQRNYPQALEYYSQAIAAQPELAEAYNNRGNVHYALGQWQEALGDYSQAIALRPSYATAHFNGGMVHYGLGNVETAIASFTKALEHHPGYAEAYNNRGNCYVIVQAYQEAIEDFDQALELNPAFTAAYNNIGNLYYQIKNFDEALASYDQSLAVQPNQPEAHNNKGNAYLALGNYAEAVENFNRATTLKADYAEAYYNRGLVHRKLGQNQEAQADLAQASQLAQQQHNAALIRAMQGTSI